MQKSIEERLELLESQNDAHMLVLIAVIAEAWPTQAHRIERRETICEAVERTFGRVSPDRQSHLNLHRVLGEVERLFETADEAL